jgi:hypothetical protein
VTGSVVFGGSFAGSDGAMLGFSGGGVLPVLGAVRSQALKPRAMRIAAEAVTIFMLLLSLETKVLRATQVFTQHVLNAAGYCLPRIRIEHKDKTKRIVVLRFESAPYFIDSLCADLFP